MDPEQIRILIADRDREFLEIVQDTLRRHFPQVSIAESGPQVLALCERNYFHLSIIGNHLPGMLGIEVARRLERSYPKMRRILTSEHDTDAVIESALDYGMIDRFLKKPLEITDLIWEVKFLLGAGIEPSHLEDDFDDLDFNERPEVSYEPTNLEYQMLLTLAK